MLTSEEQVKKVCEELSIPYKSEWIICHDCRGDGTELKGSLKGADVTDLVRDDPDFREEMMRGCYDTSCSVCKGSGKIKDYTPDFTRCSQDVINKYKEEMKEYYDYRQEEAEYARLRERGIQF